MIHAYITKNRKLCLRPADKEGEEELKEFLQDLKQNGLEMIDVETEYHEDQMYRYGYGPMHSRNSQSFGFNSPQDRYGYMAPQSYHYYPIMPLYFERGYRDSVTRGEYRSGEYDGRENPRYTGPGDAPRR